MQRCPRAYCTNLSLRVQNQRRALAKKRTRPLDWAEWLQQETVAKRQRLGKQKRKLVMHTMFSGLCSPEKSLRELGVECDNAVAAEWKPHARRFCYQNGLAPSGHFFTDAQPLPSIGTGPCCAHGGVCSLPAGKVDLFVACSHAPHSACREKALGT